MEVDKPQLELKARTYFLEQGKSIGKLNDILDSSVLLGYLKRGASLIIEALLFLIFLSILFIAIYIPITPEIEKAITDSFSVKLKIDEEHVMKALLIFKTVLFIASLMPLILMLLLQRNRRKGALINLAYEEADKMKERFDKAVKELNL